MYQYDGNRVSISQNTISDSYGTTNYTIDEDRRLEQVAATGKTTAYAYDNTGNRLTVDEVFATTIFSGYMVPAMNKALKNVLIITICTDAKRICSI